MIGILVIAHGTLATSLVNSAQHVLQQNIAQLSAFNVSNGDDPASIVPKAQSVIAQLNDGSGVLILSDMYGSTPCNIVSKLVDFSSVEAVAGVNLPMLIRALNYRQTTLQDCLAKALSGGEEGIIHFTEAGFRHYD